MTEEELKARTANLQPIDATKPQDVADKAFKEPIQPQRLDRVEVPPKPELNASMSTLEALWGWFMGFAKQETTNQFEGKPVANPFSIVSVLTNWKWLLIGLVVLGIIGLVLWLVL